MNAIKDLLQSKSITPQEESRITRSWQDKALRDMEYLGVTLKESDIARVFKIYKNEFEGKLHTTNTSRVISYLKDYPRPLNYEGKIKMFFKLISDGFSRYRSVSELTEQQSQVMKYIIWWVKNEKTPIPKKEIVKKMKEEGMKVDVINWSLGVLLSKGYIRRGYTAKMNTTVYVQLRNL